MKKEIKLKDCTFTYESDNDEIRDLQIKESIVKLFKLDNEDIKVVIKGKDLVKVLQNKGFINNGISK